MAFSKISSTEHYSRKGTARRRVLVYAAEDCLPDIRLRLASFCIPRGICLNELDLGIITVHQMHLNRSRDLIRL